MKILAKIISYLFHPLLMPTFGLWLMLSVDPYLAFMIHPEITRILFIVVFISTFVFPVLSSIFLLYAGKIESLEMQTPQERRTPYLLTTVYYTLGYYTITSKIPNLPEEVSLMLLGANLSVVLTLIINIVRKISAHAVAIGGLIGAFMGVGLISAIGFANVLALLFILAGLIGYARLKLDAHKPIEVYMGFGLGFACEFILFVFFNHAG